MSTKHTNKWESDGLMDIYYVVGVTTILYLEFGVIVNIISKEDNFYCITIGDLPQCTSLDFVKLSSMALGKKRKWRYCKCLYYVFIFLCKVNYDNNKSTYTPTYSTYNKVM